EGFGDGFRLDRQRVLEDEQREIGNVLPGFAGKLAFLLGDGGGEDRPELAIIDKGVIKHLAGRAFPIVPDLLKLARGLEKDRSLQLARIGRSYFSRAGIGLMGT